MTKMNKKEEYILVGVILFFAVFYAGLFSVFNQLPSEYYGGDHYAHLGSAWKIFNTYNPFISSNYIGELQHYPWLTPFAIAILAKIAFSNPFSIAIFFPVIIIMATIVITYLFGCRFFQSKTWALILAASWAVVLIPSIHPSEIAKQLFIPMIAYIIILLFNNNPTKKEKIIAGLFYGLTGLQHMVTFIVASISIIFVLAFNIMNNSKSWFYEIKKMLSVLIIGWSIASLFWIPLFVKYHGNTINEWQVYTSASLYPSASYISSVVASIIGFERPTIYLLFTIVLINIFLYYSIKEHDKRIFVPFLLFVAALIGIIHPYVTYPLFDMTLGYYRFSIIFVFVKHLLVVAGLYYIFSRILAGKKSILCVGYVLIIIGIIFNFMLLIHDYMYDERYFYAIASDEKMIAYKQLQQFIDVQDLITENEAVIAIHPDIAFLFNAMTGKNVLVTRVTHASPFIEYNKRIADLAVILYGNDTVKRQELLAMYHGSWLFTERTQKEVSETCKENWNIIKYGSKKDKTLFAYWCLQTDPEYQQYIESYGIETTTAFVRLAVGDKDVPLTKVLVIKSKELQVIGEEKFAFDGDQEHLRLYGLI